LFKFGKTDRLKLQLITELKQACVIASNYQGGYSGEFLDAKEFHQALNASIQAFEKGDDTQAKNLWLWFAPTTAWDDFIREEGAAKIANSIFSKLEAYIKEHDIKI